MNDDVRKRRADEWRRFAEMDGGLFVMLREDQAKAVDEIAQPMTSYERDELCADLRAMSRLGERVKAIINGGIVAEAQIAAGQKKGFH